MFPCLIFIYFASGTVTSQSLHDSASLYLQPLSGPPGVSSGLLSCCLTSAPAPGQPVLHTMITFIFVKRESSKLVSPQVFCWLPLLLSLLAWACQDLNKSMGNLPALHSFCSGHLCWLLVPLMRVSAVLKEYALHGMCYPPFFF